MNYHKVYMNHVHSSSLLCQLCTMWKSQTLCDAVIRTGTVITKAHRVVLVAACPMLQSLENATSGSHLEVRLASDIKQESVNTFLQYLYEGFMMLTEENSKDVEKIARLLQVDSVIRCCADFNKCLNVSAGQQYKYSSLDQAEFRHMRTTDILKVQEKSQKRFADAGRPGSPGSKRQRLHRPSSPLQDISMQGAGHQIHDTESMGEGYGVGANDPWDRVPRVGSGFPGATSKPGVIDIREDSLELIQTEPPKDAGGGRGPEPRKVQASVGISVASQHNTSADLRIVNVSEGQTAPKSSAPQQSGTSSSARQITVSPLMQIDSPSSSSSVDSSKFSSDRFSTPSQRKESDRPQPHPTSVNIPPSSHPPPSSSVSDFPQSTASPGRQRAQESFQTSTPQRQPLPYPVSLTAVRPTLSAQKPFAAGSATQAGLSQSFTEGMHQTPAHQTPAQRPQPVSKSGSKSESLDRPPSSGQDTEGKSKIDETPSTSDLTPDISIVKVESAGSSATTAVDVDELNMYINEAVAEASRERQGDDLDPDASANNYDLEEPQGDWSQGDMSNEGNMTGDQSGSWYPGGQFKGDQFGIEDWHQDNRSTAKAPYKYSKSGSEYGKPGELSCYVSPSGKMVVTPDLYCHPCNKRFTNSTTLARHLRIFHSDRAVPQCKLCGKRTSSWYDLKVHEKSHSTERPYKCEECQKSYKYKQDLKSHMNVFHPKESQSFIEEK